MAHDLEIWSGGQSASCSCRPVSTRCHWLGRLKGDQRSASVCASGPRVRVRVTAQGLACARVRIASIPAYESVSRWVPMAPATTRNG